MEAFTPGKNPLFEHVEVRFFLARRAGKVVGRISAQIDRAHLERYNDSTGHFGCLAAEDDPAIFAALLAAAEAWLRAKGMKHVTGPFSLSVNEEVGLLIDGFDSRPVLMVPYDPPYAARASRRAAMPRPRTSSPTTTTSRTRPRRSAPSC